LVGRQAGVYRRKLASHEGELIMMALALALLIAVVGVSVAVRSEPERMVTA
jgi:hypothetical protein